MENFSFLWESLKYLAENPKMIVMWIIGSVYLLNKAFKPRKKKNGDGEAQ